jgi:hypothetical protein
MANYKTISLHQYDSNSNDDLLLMFAAPAKEIWQWAGVPRKAWHLRMLYQRGISSGREQEVKAFWDQAGQPTANSTRPYLLGPTSLTVALQDPIEVVDGEISLHYEIPFDFSADPLNQLQTVALRVMDRMLWRLTDQERNNLESVVGRASFDAIDFGHNYVLQSMSQIRLMARDPGEFVEDFEINEEDVLALITSLEAISRPALVVDGQHRLYGAAHSEHEVWLPVVAIPNCSWVEQIYQFIVINEKAQRVDRPLLTDIFGSSLTNAEQVTMRNQLDRIGASVDVRIAAVIADRDESSPFREMIKFQMGQTRARGFVPDMAIQHLLTGGRTRGARGWQNDDEFYREFIAPTFPQREDWDSWDSGQWKPYWFAFWDEVRDFHNDHATQGPLWGEDQTNLTKAVTLRLYQRLFMEHCIGLVQSIRGLRDILIEELGEDAGLSRYKERLREAALPGTVEEFRQFVRDKFLVRGVPTRVFERPWVKSLDDSAGITNLYEELQKAFRRSQEGVSYRARNHLVFATGD